MKVFVNGNEVGTAAVNKEIDDTDNPVWIGNEGYQSNHWGGMLDEVAIFNVALTENDIKSIMTGGLSTATAVSPSGKIASTWGNIKADH